MCAARRYKSPFSSWHHIILCALVELTNSPAVQKDNCKLSKSCLSCRHNKTATQNFRASERNQVYSNCRAQPNIWKRMLSKVVYVVVFIWRQHKQQETTPFRQIKRLIWRQQGQRGVFYTPAAQYNLLKLPSSTKFYYQFNQQVILLLSHSRCKYRHKPWNICFPACKKMASP